MERELGKEFPQGAKRKEFLDSNCDAIEEKGYMKPFTPEELSEMKDTLSTITIEINDIEEEKKDAMSMYNERLKPQKKELKELLHGIKNKAEFVTENCYKIIDQEKRIVGFYNENGDLIESRAAYANELQATIFQMRRTGTNNN